MLAITEAAASAIRDITTSVPDVHGLRLEAEAPGSLNGSAPNYVIAVSAASQPDDLDQIISEHGARVFVDAGLVGYVDDKVLDVGVDEAGAAFTLSERE